LTDRVTPTEHTIVLCHHGVPRVAPEAWSLTIDGLARRSLCLSLDDLERRPRVEVASVHQCAGSPLQPHVPTRRVCAVVWAGVRLADLIADCGPLPAARFLWSFGADYGTFEGIACEAYVKDLPIDRVTHDVLLAYEMNGAPLRPENGFPVRLVVPGFYGTNSVKWITRIALADRRADGPFTTHWYNDPVLDPAGRPTGETRPVWAIAPESVIVAPGPGAAIHTGAATTIWGWAWGDGGISSVELSVDGGGSWRESTLEPSPGRAWQRFQLDWLPTAAGPHRLCARATSLRGESQPPSGARNAIHCVEIQVT
jgi:DMSO/TMAO reductase YedYZ molybdopterin-dependent catalytic subunit